MSRTDRRRHRARPVAEALKSVLIVILALNAVYLTALAISAGTPGGGSPAGLLEQLRSALAGDQGEGETAQTGQPAMAARPVRMAVVNSQGRYAAEYDAALTDQLFDQLAGLLSEALASAQAPRQVTQSAWRQALCEPGVYFDLLGDVPLDALYAWLGEGGSNPSLDGAAVDVAATGWAAEFTVEEGYITGYTLHFRSYEETVQRVSQLPLAQAAAALEALDGAGRELLVCYTDSGETVTAGWTAE